VKMEVSSPTKYIDLHLPSNKSPSPLKNNETTPFSTAITLRLANENGETSDSMSTAVGTTGQIYNPKIDTGFFSTVFTAWSNHLNIRTCPEDWWLPVITHVAKLVDDYADTMPLRNYFVGGRSGKEKIVVEVPSFSIYDTDYTYVFNSFSSQINQRITVPGYVKNISASFSTTTPDQLIGSQITIMKSFQKYFDYEMGLCGCGIKGLEMSGTEQDWRLLKEKLTELRKLLAPIESTLRIVSYFQHVEQIYDNLLKTYLGHNMDQWWSKVLYDCKEVEYGPSGMEMEEVDAYNGWIVFFCNGVDYPLKASELSIGEYKDLSCLSSCPLKIVDRLRDISDNATLMGGILGFYMHNQTANGVPSLQPAHGWALLLPINSPLR